MTRPAIYLPDTNMLYDLATLYGAPGQLKYWQENNIKKYWRNFGQKTRIPSLIWVEFCGSWFNTRVDLGDYDKWFENRHIVFHQVFNRVKQAGSFPLNESGLDHRKVMQNTLIVNKRKMPEGLIERINMRLKKQIEKKVKNKHDAKGTSESVLMNKNLLRTGQGKLLDGFDSIFVVFAYEYARSCPDRDIVVVTRDNFLIDAVQYFKENNTTFKNYTIPENVSASLPWNVGRAT